jgi:hypothetical protein
VHRLTEKGIRIPPPRGSLAGVAKKGAPVSLITCDLSVTLNGFEIRLALMKESEVRKRKTREIWRWNYEVFISGFAV